MNREQRERREHGEANQYKLSQVFPCFAVIFTSEIQRTLPLNSMNHEQHKGYKQRETDRTNFRGFRAFRGENYNGHSLGGAKVFLFLLDRPPFSLHNPL